MRQDTLLSESFGKLISLVRSGGGEIFFSQIFFSVLPWVRWCLFVDDMTKESDKYPDIAKLDDSYFQ